jgi:hypothetical protein
MSSTKKMKVRTEGIAGPEESSLAARKVISHSGDWRPRPALESSNGILTRERRSRMHKQEREYRSRGPRKVQAPGGPRLVRLQGIDIVGDRQVVAVVDERGALILKATA